MNKIKILLEKSKLGKIFPLCVNIVIDEKSVFKEFENSYISTLGWGNQDHQKKVQKGFLEGVFDEEKKIFSIAQYKILNSKKIESKYEISIDDYLFYQYPTDGYNELTKKFPLYVCSFCRERRCGIITVKIVKTKKTVIWQNIRYGFSGTVQDKLLEIGPFEFEWDEYKREIEGTYGALGFSFPF